MTNFDAFSQADIARLRESLLAADYEIDAVMEAVGPSGQAGLARNHTIAASHVLGDRSDPLARLIRLFVLQQPQPRARIAEIVDLPALLEAGLLEEARAEDPSQSHRGAGSLALSTDPTDDLVRATIDIRPYSDDGEGVSGWAVSDHVAALDTAAIQFDPNHVLGISAASISLAHLTSRRPVVRALDLGTGCGIQCLHLAGHSEKIVATDLNPRALAMARLTCGLNGIDVERRLGSLFDPVEGESFDLIVTNPPFVISPPRADRLIYRESSQQGDDLMRQVVNQGSERLSPGGTLVVVGNWAHTAGQTWQERVDGWVPAGYDVIAIERELLDVYEYAEVWLADAGWSGTPHYRRRYEEWLRYFDQLGIESVGLGWILVQRNERREPGRRHLPWAHPVDRPADELMACFDAIGPSRWSDEELLARHWILAADTVQETLGPPGGADPAHVVLRRQHGLKRAIEVGTALGGVLGACDGELALRQIIDAVASLTDVDAHALRGEILLDVRSLIADTWLSEAR
ncbi:MAG: methyltransferase [Propionibacteriaceae bacterium]|nr:methyltransferase [Propionibacteriaceae bacterium]